MDAPNRISRRRMLKRIGAGAAVAWSAPIISSLRTPAFAQVSPGACPDWNCGDPLTECAGTPCGIGPCVCDTDVEGNPFCWDNFFCSDTVPCSNSAECNTITRPNWRCTTSCCGQTCAPPCGECGDSETPRVSSSGGRATGAGV